MKRKREESAVSLEIELPPEEPPSKKLAGLKPWHPDLPQAPFFVGIIGPRHSGKSVLLFNLLSDRPGWYGGSFKKSNIIFYSKTKDKDTTMKHLKLENVYGPPTHPDWVVKSVQEKQKAFMEAEDMTGVLLVFDDATQLRDAWPVIEELSYTGRHDHIHTIYVAHKMSSIPRGVRTQTQQWILYKPHEQSEWQWIVEMFSTRQTRDLWMRVMSRAWQKTPENPKPFIYIDFEEEEPDRIYRYGFHEPLFTPEELPIITGDMQIDANGKKVPVFNEMKQEEEEVSDHGSKRKVEEEEGSFDPNAAEIQERKKRKKRKLQV